MSEYHIVWEIDVDATNPVNAAREAQRIQRDPTSIATVFQVETTATNRDRCTIDLADYTEDVQDTKDSNSRHRDSVLSASFG